MHLFKIDNNNSDNDHIYIKGNNFFHIIKVLRGKVDNIIYAKDTSYIYKLKIVNILKDSLQCLILSKEAIKNSQPFQVQLFLAIIKFSNFELILNSITQLGVNKIIPMQTEFTQKYDLSSNRISRWQKIIQEACKQSFNVQEPLLAETQNFKSAIQEQGINILFHPDAISLKDQLSGLKDKFSLINIFIGPEAGFSVNEIEMAKQNKSFIVSLPYPVLRTETAVIVAISNILFFYS